MINYLSVIASSGQYRKLVLEMFGYRLLVWYGTMPVMGECVRYSNVLSFIVGLARGAPASRVRRVKMFRGGGNQGGNRTCNTRPAKAGGRRKSF